MDGQAVNGRAAVLGATMSLVRNAPALRSMVLTVLVVVAGSAVPGNVAAGPLASPEPPDPPDTIPLTPGSTDAGTPITNDFYPDERDVTDCVGALERPGCGSSSRGGWRQGAILGTLVVAIGFICWRIAKAVRR